MSCRVAIIGGGPGGLMTAWLLRKYCPSPLAITIYEAAPRLGGKILTRRFHTAPIPYEAGAAELYDYSHLGQDPLRELIAELGLTTASMSGASLLFGPHVVHSAEDFAARHGEATRRALLRFDQRARRWMSPQEYYETDSQESAPDPMQDRTFEQELALIPDAPARNFIRILVHSDVATEPHLTSAAYGLQNYLMNDPAYMRLYTIQGGIECLPRAIAARLDARTLLNQPVHAVTRNPGGALCVSSRRVSPGEPPSASSSEDFDFVVAALPNNYLPSIQWQGEALADALHRHHIHHDHPAHYLRISILFREPFWRHILAESFLMSDAFGGCCLYDESARSGCDSHGALGWLLAGNAALTAANHSDETLIGIVLDSLPRSLQHGRELFLEGRVHRWLGAVNGLPGGHPVLPLQARHMPDPSCPNLLVVGDYLFDSTLNGVLDSADFVAETIAERILAASSPTPSVMVNSAS